jgi:hypothetical protein
VGAAGKTAVGIQPGGEQQHAVRHAVEAAGNRLFQQRRSETAAVVEQVVAVFIDQAAMHVHAVTGQSAEGLGHEGRQQTVVFRHAANQALQHHGLVRCQQGIVAVVQVDLVLGGAGLLDQGIHRQVLVGGGVENLMHQFSDIAH